MKYLSTVMFATLVAVSIASRSDQLRSSSIVLEPKIATKVLQDQNLQVQAQIVSKANVNNEPIVTLRDPPLAILDFEPYTQLLPPEIRDYINRGSFNESTLRNNRDSFNRFRIRPKLMRDVSNPSLSTTILGRRVSIPIGASSIYLPKIANPEGDLGIARACEALGNTMIVSFAASETIEAIAAAAPQNCNRLLEVLIFRNRTATYELVKRAEASGYRGIVLDINIDYLGIRTYNSYSNLQFPSNIRAVNLPADANPLTPVYNGDIPLTDLASTWDDVAWLVRTSRLPILVKGVLTAGDALQAVEAGASGVIVSNNNGRQLDRVPAVIEALPEVVNAVGNRVEVHLEGAGLDGTQTLIALALGARSIFIFRPIYWGLAYNGGAGVRLVFEVLARELQRAMILAGTPRADAIDRDLVVQESFYYSPPGGRLV